MDVTILIVSYNGRELLADCLRSILGKTRRNSCEIIVVDNSSVDGSAMMIAELFPMVHCIKKSVNVGFAKAVNIGARQAKGKYLLILNPDTVFINDAVGFFYDYLNAPENAHVGVIGGYLERVDGTIIHSEGRFQNPLRYICNRMRSVIRERLALWGIPQGIYVYGGCDKDREVDYVTGADMFVNRERFLAFGGFDERFFMYCEDSEFQWRLKCAGWHRRLIAGPRIVHIKGYSLNNSVRRIVLERSERSYKRLVYGPWLGACYDMMLCGSIFAEAIFDLVFWRYAPAQNLFFFKNVFAAPKLDLAGLVAPRGGAAANWR